MLIGWNFKAEGLGLQDIRLFLQFVCCDPTYNKRQEKVFQCDAISQKLDDPEES